MCNTKADKAIIENDLATALRTVPVKVFNIKQPKRESSKPASPLATNGIEAGVKVRPTGEELRQDYMKEFRSGWDSYSKEKPDKPIMHYSVVSGFFGDHMLIPYSKFCPCSTSWNILSRGSTHIVSLDPYEAADLIADFMNDERDKAPIIWGYIKSRETARRMEAYAGESLNPNISISMIPTYTDLNLQDTNAYGGPSHLSAGIQYGSWSIQTKPGNPPKGSFVTSSQVSEMSDDLDYTAEDIKQTEEWVKRHVETTWHSLSTCSMAPKEGNSIVIHGVLDPRLDVHGVKGLKCADLSICPDNVGCNTSRNHSVS
ncbi:hypothetical protein N7G274_009306 [Stereocaulon virgatum]|uniref:Glucose-methanol-choline oxidoreductase C-terminal domain-containing protein n=1 Tax=Stereocaulon virgatum TaxID=373712 RepID=A0ABR4A0H8_9LECA